MLLFDAHLDLSLDALHADRDLTLPVAEIRRREAHLTDKKDRGMGTVSLPEMRRGQVGLCVATQLARQTHGETNLPPIPSYNSAEIAWAIAQGQLAWYRVMEDAGHLIQIVDADGLHRHLALWQDNPPDDAPIGYVLSLEGADSILTPGHLERAYADGLRAVGPVHYGHGRYGNGTHVGGGLNPAGRDLLAEMGRLGIILDVTHLSEESFWEALDGFRGAVWASHHNCRTLVPGDRQLSDEQIRALVERGAVIAAACDAWMLVPGWVRGQSTPEQTGVCLDHVVNHIDHVCQVAGNARHAAIGSDLDGGYGREQTPRDLDTIADLQGIAPRLLSRGYSDEDVRCIMHGNLIRVLEEAWS